MESFVFHSVGRFKNAQRPGALLAAPPSGWTEDTVGSWELLFTLRTAGAAEDFIDVMFSFSDKKTFVKLQITVRFIWGWNLGATLPGSVLFTAEAAA